MLIPVVHVYTRSRDSELIYIHLFRVQQIADKRYGRQKDTARFAKEKSQKN